MNMFRSPSTTPPAMEARRPTHDDKDSLDGDGIALQMIGNNDGSPTMTPGPSTALVRVPSKTGKNTPRTSEKAPKAARTPKATPKAVKKATPKATPKAASSKGTPAKKTATPAKEAATPTASKKRSKAAADLEDSEEESSRPTKKAKAPRGGPSTALVLEKKTRKVGKGLCCCIVVMTNQPQKAETTVC